MIAELQRLGWQVDVINLGDGYPRPSAERKAEAPALLAAAAAGCPVVATAVGGIPEVVIAGRTGLVVEPKSPASLAEAINRLLDSPAEAGRMGSLGRRWARRKFDWQQVARGYASVLAQAASRNGGSYRRTDQ
jgi:glycosyltransferase involved in cell wall biosynthesis